MKTTAYVCVHGMGTHDSGALAADALEAVQHAASTAGGRLITQPIGPEAPTELIHRAVVEYPHHEPFIAEFYDGWWDRGLDRPSFWPVLGWALRIAPLVMLNTAWLWFGDRLADRSTASLRSWAQAILPAALFLVLAPAVIVLLPVVLAAAAVVPPLRRAVHRVTVDFIGDAWLYRSDQLNRLVLPRLTTLTRTAGKHAQTVVLVGHSQGAELTRRVGLRLAREQNTDDDVERASVWVGSGENQLNAVRALARTRWLPVVLWPYLLAWPVFLHPVVNRLLSELIRAWTFAVDGHIGPAALAGAVALLLAAAMLAFVAAGMFFTRLVARPPSDAGRLPPGRHWYVQSILDPISFGSAAVRSRSSQADQVRIRYVPRAGQAPWWQQHTTYFSKPHTGEVLIAAGAEQPAQLTWGKAPRVPSWLLILCAVVIAAVLTGGYYLGGWQWSLLRG